MRILFIGDIVGASGRHIVVDHLSGLASEYKIDFVIANGENSAHGKGITFKIYNQLLDAGVDCITMGNHTFAKRELLEYLDQCDHLLIPANMKDAHRGQSYKVYTVKGVKVCVVNLYGEAFMNNTAGSPYPYMDAVLDEVESDLYIVDFHAESNSEKMLFANVYADRVHAVIGTHTHVQTADNRLIGNTAYITDVGMCGAYDSIIGRDVEELYQNVILKEKTHFKVALGDAFMNAVLLDIDEKEKKAVAIQRINFG